MISLQNSLNIMKVTLLVCIVVIIVASAESAMKEFNFGGWSGVVESFGKIDGVESENHDQVQSKAEQVIKKLIEKHLAGKKQAKKQINAQKSGQTIPVLEQQPEPTSILQQPQTTSDNKLQLPTSINWDDHKETRDELNQKIPGGTASVDALIKLLQEGGQQEAQK